MSAKRRDRKKRLVKKYLSQKTDVWHNTEANYKFVLNMINMKEFTFCLKQGFVFLMGHSDIGVTLNTYTHVGYEDVKEKVRKICNL